MLELTVIARCLSTLDLVPTICFKHFNDFSNGISSHKNINIYYDVTKVVKAILFTKSSITFFQKNLTGVDSYWGAYINSQEGVS